MPMRRRGRKPGAVHAEAEIIRQRARDGTPIARLAAGYGVHRTTILRIIGPKIDRSAAQRAVNLLMQLYTEPSNIDDPAFRIRMLRVLHVLDPAWQPPDEP